MIMNNITHQIHLFRPLGT